MSSSGVSIGEGGSFSHRCLDSIGVKGFEGMLGVEWRKDVVHQQLGRYLDKEVD